MRRALILSLLLLAACKQSAPSEEPSGNVTATPTAPSAEPSLSSLALDVLRDNDGEVISTAMSSIGGCAFYDKDDRALLSVGIPDNYGKAEGAGGPAIGVARVNGAQTRLAALKADAGYVEGGPQLSGGGFTLTVMRAEGEGKSTGREEVEYTADLVVSDGSGDARTYTPGAWRCGV